MTTKTQNSPTTTPIDDSIVQKIKSCSLLRVTTRTNTRQHLRAATRDNPRDLPCPTCHKPNRLTHIDRMRGYQCDSCADSMERGGGY